MLDLSDSRVRRVVFNWFETVNKGGLDETGLWAMTDAFLRHLKDVEQDQEDLRMRVTNA